MAKIVSKRGQQKTEDSIEKSPDMIVREMQIYIIDGGDFEPTPEQLEHIRRVFDNIRKQLDSIFWEDDEDLSGFVAKYGYISWDGVPHLDWPQ